MSYDTFKKYLPISIVGIVLVLLNLFAVIWYLMPAGPDQWNEEVIPGKVVTISDTSLVTRDPRGNSKTFIINDETKIFKGKKVESPALLIPGTMVLVEKVMGTSTEMVAKEIRIITDMRKEKSLP